MKSSAKLLVVAVTLVASTALARGQGQVSITGQDTYTNASQTIAFVDDGLAYGDGATGIFANLFSNPGTSSANNLNVVFNNSSFDYSTFTGPEPVFGINDGDTPGGQISFVADSIAASSQEVNGQPGEEIVFTGYYYGQGTLSPLGDIDGTFTVTTQDGGSNVVTYSATALAPTPEPSSLLLLGTGLLGSAGMLYRRNRFGSAV